MGWVCLHGSPLDGIGDGGGVRVSVRTGLPVGDRINKRLEGRENPEGFRF